MDKIQGMKFVHISATRGSRFTAAFVCLSVCFQHDTCQNCCS